MKRFFLSLVALILIGSATTYAQQTTGPNLLGAKGTFSAPFVTPSTTASTCTNDGAHTYSPLNNVGNALSSLNSSNSNTLGVGIPASSYTYANKNNPRNQSLEQEGNYSLVKIIGDATGGNCLKQSQDWRGWDHTGDGGWFMAVNGKPAGNSSSISNIFYTIKGISVCPGTKYEFSAFVATLLPSSSEYATPGSRPNISFVVRWGTGSNQSLTVSNTGAIDYTATPTWRKFGGTFTVPNNVSSVDLEVVNATSATYGNDFGLDDISLNVYQSDIVITGETPLCEGTSSTVNFAVTDATQTNTWYKWQLSTDGGGQTGTYTDITAPAQGSFTGNTYTVPLNLTNVSISQNGYKYRLVVAQSQAALSNIQVCTSQNEYTLVVTQCGPTPVTLTSFTGKYANGEVVLDWQTSQEMNNDRFDIYRSTDGQTFTLINAVKGNGNSNMIRDYRYVDVQPGSSKYAYYRLAQVDLDGKRSFSNVVKVSLGSIVSLEVYPNPFVSNFTVSFTADKNAEAKMIIRNVVGQAVMQRSVTTVRGNNTINISNLSSLKTGIYYVTIVNDDINFNVKLQKQ